MLPKVIHYCWFGGNPKPDLILRCIESWKRYCPDWEIKEWNESNFDINQHPFMRDAYDAQKWAFVSDLTRLMIVHEHGGVYLDTDVELKCSLDDLASYHCFFAFDNFVSVNTGIGFGAIAAHPHVQAMLACYNDLVFDPQKPIACPILNTKALTVSCPELVIDGTKTQIINNCIFLSVKDFAKVGHHHGMQSWVDGPKFVQENRKRTNLSLCIQNWLKQPRKFAYIERHFGEKVLQIYTFIAYDLFDCGIGFFIKRLIHRLKKK